MTFGQARNLEDIRQQSLGIADRRYMPAVVEKVRIINVNIEDWSVDCVSEYANKRFFDVQVMSPYFHFVNGEGIYAMPEVGALAWLCKPSSGQFAPEFLLGYMAPFDEENVNFRAGRQTLNPGDIMMRTRDENFIILRRGGAIQIGSTPTAQRIYLPIQNVIRDFCENYQLFTFGGELLWETDRDDKTTTGDAPTKFSLKAKAQADDPQHIAELTIGSHGESDPTTLNLTIWTSGEEDREARVQLRITKQGDVTWEVEQNHVVNVSGNYEVNALGNVALGAQGTAEMRSTQGTNILSDLLTIIEGKTGVTIKTAGALTLAASTISMGPPGVGAGTPQSSIKGPKLLEAIDAIVNAIDTAANSAPLAALKSVKVAWETVRPTVSNPNVLT